MSGKASLDISPFINDQGLVQVFTISVGNAAGDGTDQVRDFSFENPVLTANLHVPRNLPLNSKFTGRLLLTVPGQAQPIVWRFLLTSAEEMRPATLVLDRNAVAVTAISPLLCLSWIGVGCLGGQPAVVTVHVRDKAGDWPLNAVTARVEASSSSAGADFQRVKIVSTTFDGQDAGDIFASSRSGVVRNVVPRGQGAITLTFDKNLEAGEYQLPLHFTAANSGKVRHNIFWAIATLVVAALVSFLATRVVTGLRQRANFLSRVHAMRPTWLYLEEATILPVIWLRAKLRERLMPQIPVGSTFRR